MTNRKTGKETVKIIFDVLEEDNFKTVNQISETTGLSYDTVKRWLEIIELIIGYFLRTTVWAKADDDLELYQLEISQVGRFKGYRLRPRED